MALRVSVLLICWLVAWSSPDAYAQRATVRGLVIGSEAGLALPGATVLLETVDGDGTYGTATDGDGLYVLARVREGRYRLRVSFVGYAPFTDSVEVAAGRVNRFDVTLSPSDAELDELVVEGERARDDYRAGVRSIEPADVERVPVPDVSGDLAAYLTTLPGVVTTGSTGGQLFIRGGEPSQNLVLLDGIPLYQPFHVLGFYSAFPSDIVREADVYAGGFGARYGGRLSSVIDVSSRNGNLRRVEAAASAAPFVSGLRAEFPVVRDRFSVLASGRLSVIDEGASRLVDEPLPYRFGDAFVKLHGRLVENSHLSITGVHTFDEGTLREPSPQQPVPPEVRWQNTGIGARYLFLPGTSPFRGEIVVGLTRFDTETGPPGQRFPDREARIEKWSSRMEITQYGQDSQVRAGMFAGTTQLSNDLSPGSRQNGITLTDFGAYLEPEFRVWRDVRMAAGLRIHSFPSLSSTFIEPRLRASWQRSIHQVSAAGGLYHQEIVGVTDRRDAAGVFTVWTPTPVRDVARAVHALLGYRVTPTVGLSFSAEGYLKFLTNLSVGEWTAYPRFTTNLQPADGTASGLDLRLDVQRGAFTGALSYSLASVRYAAQQEQLPVWYGVEELEYRPTHDRRHQVDALAGVTLLGFDLSIRWQFGSGLPYSRALGFDRFLFLDGGVDVFEEPATDRVIYERPFNATLPTYHRLDVSVERSVQLGPATLTVQAGLINVYDRANLFYYDAFTLQRVDQLPLLPSFGLKLAY